jgi:hypothetical protein
VHLLWVYRRALSPLTPAHRSLHNDGRFRLSISQKNRLVMPLAEIPQSLGACPGRSKGLCIDPDKSSWQDDEVNHSW